MPPYRKQPLHQSALTKYTRSLPLMIGFGLGLMLSTFWNGMDLSGLIGFMAFGTLSIIGAGTLGILLFDQPFRTFKFSLIGSLVGFALGLLMQPQTYVDWAWDQRLVSNVLIWPFKFLVAHAPFGAVLVLSAFMWRTTMKFTKR